MPAMGLHSVDDQRPDLLCAIFEFGIVETSQIGGTGDVLQNHDIGRPDRLEFRLLRKLLLMAWTSGSHGLVLTFEEASQESTTSGATQSTSSISSGSGARDC
jgi:hypothetical protein